MVPFRKQWYEVFRTNFSGTSGATGSGDTTTVTFNTLSKNTHDYKTAVATVQNGGSNTANVIVADGVTSVTLQPVDPATIFDDNPNTGAGKRIFPDKNPPLPDTVDRRKVRVKALTTFGSGKTIYFKSFDLDDPSTDAAPMDSNGSLGNDNRGGSGTAAQYGILSIVGGSGTTNSVSAATDANGIASADLTVTMQPGDNFMVAASHDQTYLNGLTVDRITLKDSSGNAVGSVTPKAKASQMLTVWRRVHVEVDSMGIVPSTGPQKNSVTGKITSINGTSTMATLVFTDQNLNDGSPKLDDQPPGNGRFENGTIRIGTTGSVTETADLQGNGTDYLQKNTGNGIVIPCAVSRSGVTDVTGNVISLLSNVFTIRITGGTLTANFVDGTITVGGVSMVITAVNVTDSSVTVNALADIPFNLVDDDDFNNDDGSNLDGDEGENVYAPDTSLLQNAFAPAYVLPVFDVGDNNDFVTFVLNTDTRNPPASIISTYDFDQVATEADANFWTVYLLGAYQGWTNEDHDPSTDDRVYGIVDAINGQGASVFNEVIRPPEGRFTTEVNNAATTAHEIGHLFNGQHIDGGLMEQSATRSSIVFSDITLNKIRSINHP